MEKQTLPNSTAVLILGILSIIGCCCYGLPGLILGIVAIFMAVKPTKLYNESPESYTGYGNVKAGKIMGIIGVILSILMIAYTIWALSYFGWETLQDPALMQEKMKELQGL